MKIKSTVMGFFVVVLSVCGCFFSPFLYAWGEKKT